MDVTDLIAGRTYGRKGTQEAQTRGQGKGEANESRQQRREGKAKQGPAREDMDGTKEAQDVNEASDKSKTRKDGQKA